MKVRALALLCAVLAALVGLSLSAAGLSGANGGRFAHAGPKLVGADRVSEASFWPESHGSGAVPAEAECEPSGNTEGDDKSLPSVADFAAIQLAQVHAGFAFAPETRAFAPNEEPSRSLCVWFDARPTRGPPV